MTHSSLEIEIQEVRYKKYIDRFITKNYDILKRLSIADCKNTNFDPDDLLNELVHYLYTHRSKIQPMIKDFNKLDDNIKYNKGSDLMRYSNTWMWQQSHFYKANRQLSNFKSKFQYWDCEKITNNKDNYYVSNEDSDYINDLKSIFSDEQIKKIIFAKHIYEELNEFEKKLYNLHFVDDLPHYKISELLKDGDGRSVSSSSVYLLLVNLRKKIKSLYEYRNS